MGEGPLEGGNGIGVFHTLKGGRGDAASTIAQGIETGPGGIEAFPGVIPGRQANGRGIGDDEGGELGAGEGRFIVGDVEAEAAAPPRLMGA